MDSGIGSVLVRRLWPGREIATVGWFVASSQSQIKGAKAGQKTLRQDLEKIR